MKQQIYYHHTDCGGVVYYANYLSFFEEARTEFFVERGIFMKEILKAGTGFVVARQEVDYKAPAVYGDILDIKASVSEASGVKIIFEQEVYNQNKQLLTKGKTIMVCVDNNLRPKAIPEELRAKISGGKA